MRQSRSRSARFFSRLYTRNFVYDIASAATIAKSQTINFRAVALSRPRTWCSCGCVYVLIPPQTKYNLWGDHLYIHYIIKRELALNSLLTNRPRYKLCCGYINIIIQSMQFSLLYMFTGVFALCFITVEDDCTRRLSRRALLKPGLQQQLYAIYRMYTPKKPSDLRIIGVAGQISRLSTEKQEESVSSQPECARHGRRTHRTLLRRYLFPFLYKYYTIREYEYDVQCACAAVL